MNNQHENSLRLKKTAPLSIKANMLWNSMGSFIYMLAQWITTVLVVRLSVGFDAAGIYTYVISIYAIFSAVADYRMYAYQVSDLHNENTLGEYFVFRCATCALSIVMTMVYAFLTSEPQMWLPIFLYLLYKDLSLLIDVFHAEEQKCERMDYVGISIALQGVVSVVLFWLAFWLTGDLNITILAMAVGTIVVGVLYDLPRVKYFASISLRFDMRKNRRLLLTCLPGVLALVALAGSASVPRQYLLNSMGDSSLGAYGTIAAPLAVIQTCANFIFSPLLGYFTAAYESHNKREFSRLLILTIVGVVVLTVFFGIALFFLGDFFYSLIYGDEVLAYMNLVPLLVISSASMAFAAFLNTLLVALRNFKATFVGGIVALIVSVVAMVPLVHMFDLNGVTLSILVGTILSSIVMMLVMARQLRANWK